jgi:hypothetical protein
MEQKTSYYLDDKNRLWKKDDYNDYFFSRKKLDWIESKICYIWGHWDFDYRISENKAMEIIEEYKKLGELKEEEIPFHYYANDNDSIFALDIFWNHYYVLADMTLCPAPSGTVDCMWGGTTEEDARSVVEKNYGEGKWILFQSGKKLEYCINEHIGEIFLNEKEEELSKNDGKYKSRIIHDDGIDYPAYVAYLEADSLEELKKITEEEIKRREQFSKSYLSKISTE